MAVSAHCANIPTITERGNRQTPIHVGIDKELQVYKAQYDALAFLHGIKFNKPVTIGFTYIKMKKKGDRNIVGLCTYGKNFREIDVDYHYWRKSSPLTRQTLIYHEITHCSCHRMHDWGKNLDYPEANDDGTDSLGTKIIEIDFTETKTAVNGFLDDECPMSLMYPRVVDDECMTKHQEMYLKEMFDRCDPY